jgi:heme-degrading monooxygenase HmoA
MIANTPLPPYYAVIFTSVRTPEDKGYASMSDAMVEEVQKQPGFLGFESARTEIGITVSYWKDRESVAAWKAHREHSIARKKGKEDWYSSFKVRICRVERDYGWTLH